MRFESIKNTAINSNIPEFKQNSSITNSYYIPYKHQYTILYNWFYVYIGFPIFGWLPFFKKSQEINSTTIIRGQ